MGLFDRLSRALDDALLLSEDLREAILRAKAELDAGRPEAALEHLEPVLAERPDHPLALYFAGHARRALGDLAGAGRDLALALERAPEDPDIARALGDVEMARGRPAPAAEAYRAAALRLVRAGGAPFAAVATSLASAWTKLGRHDRAARELRKAAAAAPDARTLHALGVALLADGEHAAAVRALRRALDLDPPPDALADLGRALLEAGDADSAEAALRLAQAASPETPGLGTVLAQALLATGDREGAEAEARAATRGRADPAASLVLAEVAKARGDARTEIDSRLAAGDERGALVAAIRSDDPRLAEIALRVRRSQPDDPTLAAADALLAETADAARALEVAARFPDAERVAARAVRALVAPPGSDSDAWSVLERLARHAAAHGPGPLAREAERLLAERDRPLRLAVMGEFNAGKSTFINAWIGEEVAPMGVTPTTATLNLLGYGAEKRVRVHLSDDSAREGGFDDLRGLLADAAREGPSRVSYVEILFPSEELLRAQIIDTPGLNAPIEAHERTALRALDEADAIVFLFRAGQAGKDTERAALEKMRARGLRVLGVVNHADRVSSDELPGIVARLREALGDSMEDVVCVSAREALVARRSSDDALFAKSGFAAVRAQIEERFFVPAREIKRGAVAARAREALGAALGSARQRDAALEASVRTLEAKRARLPEVRNLVHAALRRASGTLADGLSQSARAGAAEVATFLAPRRRFWETGRVVPEDLEFLSDFLDDALREVARSVEARLGEDLALALAEIEPTMRVSTDGALRGAVLLARGLRRGGRLERALLDSLEREADESLVQRLRIVTDGVLEEADLSLTALTARALADADASLATRLEEAAQARARHRVMAIAVLEGFAGALVRAEP